MSLGLPRKFINLKIVTTDGADAEVVDVETGEAVVFGVEKDDGTGKKIFVGSHYRWHMLFAPEQGGLADVVVELRNMPIESPCKTPFEAQGSGPHLPAPNGQVAIGQPTPEVMPAAEESDK